MRVLVYAVVVAFGLLSSFTSNAAETCATDQRQLHPGEPCIPEPLFNYLFCLSNSGGGRIEIVNKAQTETTKNLEIKVKGKGSGIVLKGEGSAGVQSSEASRAGKELSERLDPTLAARCESILRLLVPPPRKGHMSEVEPDINRDGSDYKDFVAGSITECLETCVQEKQCRAITYNKSSRQCWMKHSVPLRSNDSSYVSAVKVGGE
jgi:hypothetical protein